MAWWTKSTKKQHRWRGKSEAKAAGKRAQRDEDRAVVIRERMYVELNGEVLIDEERLWPG